MLIGHVLHNVLNKLPADVTRHFAEVAGEGVEGEVGLGDGLCAAGQFDSVAHAWYAVGAQLRTMKFSFLFKKDAGWRDS